MSNKFIKIWAAEQPLIKQHLQMRRYVTHSHVVGNVPLRSLIFVENGYISNYFDEDSIVRIKDDGKRLLDKKEGLALIEETKNIIIDYWEKAKTLRDNKNLKSFNDFEDALLEVFAYFITSSEYVTFHAERRIEEILKERYGEKYHSLYLLLTTPTRKDLLYKEKLHWLSVVKKPERRSIIEHMLKFPFLFANMDSEEDAIGIMNRRLKEKSYEEIIEELERSEQNLSDVKKAQLKIYEEIQSDELFFLSNLIRALSILRFGLKAAWSGMHFYLMEFFRMVAFKSDCEVEDVMMYFSTEDIRNLLEKDVCPSSEDVRRRRKYYAYYYENDKISFYSGEEAMEFAMKLIPTTPEVESFKGMVANMGKATGKVILLKTDNLSEISRISKTMKGDCILVTGMTNPNMIMLIEKVKGIVTDEGGIACHASIISREFGLPCIIGTKIATEVLKDNDFIEVDANEGIVRKISEQ